jgi:hypothetical protein
MYPYLYKDAEDFSDVRRGVMFNKQDDPLTGIIDHHLLHCTDASGLYLLRRLGHFLLDSL